MKLDLRVIALLLLIPLLDAMLLAVLATRLSFVAIVALVVLTALVGMLLVRAEGRRTLARLQKRIATGEMPTDELVDGGLLLIAGGMFLTPGLVTDFVAVLLTLPPTRYPLRLVVKRYVVTPYLDAKTGGFATGNVYTGGFPNDGSGPNPSDGDTIDMDSDEYRNVDSNE
ncbi:membrane protein FxsA [Halobacteriales archaeon QH_7_65_31]|nr:MAG: membrane protein FxsA [Halobacteriales archaeon QH_7_65_31]PSQ30902.1 MAG: membrane protein FxsA [Halobacteriales archaeon SW_6_65_46]